ncbi:MAG: COX15/CtaA family protein [Phycisphaerales bacterium]|nr:COX15/CtaA family protein [Phycisphaerales bacterium]
MTQPISGVSTLGGVLTNAFGATVALWILGYLTHIPGIQTPPAIVFFVLLVGLLSASLIAGRSMRRGAIGGAYFGLAIGLLNLLVLGSLLTTGAPDQTVPRAAIFVPGWLLISTIIGLIGGVVGSRTAPAAACIPNWTGRFALVAVAATLLLILAGGVVTGYQAGLAVPDWPNSFGYNMFLYPLSRMTGGIYYEHTHRLIGSLIGLTTLVLCAYLWIAERRIWVKIFGTTLLAAVIAQGVMGGLRVTDQSIQLAVIHGVFAQCFLAGLCSLAAITSVRYRDRAVPESHAGASIDRALGLIAAFGLLFQTTLGALVRHLGWALQLHIIMAVVVAAIVFIFALRCWGLYEKIAVIPVIGGALIYLVGAQLMLGVAALIVTGIEEQIPAWVQVIATTAHQTTGALLLAVTTSLVVWHFRLVETSPFAAPAAEARHQTGDSAPATSAS